jgi:channel protein (hemolysin III family)
MPVLDPKVAVDDLTNKATLEFYHLPGFHDPVSSMSHLFGAVLFSVLGYLLLRRGRGDKLRMTFLGIYALSCILLFSMSGVYHMMVGGTARDVLGRLDHNAIFLLIAGSFTPAHGILFRGWLRWAPLLFIWTAAITGITLKTIFFNDLPQWAGLVLYLILGWLGALSGILLYRLFGYPFIRPLLWGGIAYSIGGAIDGIGWPILIPGVVGPHEAFHFAVLAGALLHWRFNWQFASKPLLALPNEPPMVLTATTEPPESSPT